MSTQNDLNIKDMMLTKLSYERCEQYISSMRALLHIHQEEEALQSQSFQSLWQILNLMSAELDLLSNTLEKQIPTQERAA